MRIAIDALPLIAHKNPGGEIFVINMINKLSEIDKDNEYIVFIQEELKGLKINNPKVKFKKRPFLKLAWWRFIYEQLFLPLELLFCKADLLFIPLSIGLLFPPCKMVLTIHDVAYLNFPSFFRIDQLLVRKWLFLRTMRKATKIAAISHYSADEIRQKLSLSVDEVIAIPSGIELKKDDLSQSDVLETCGKFGLKGNFFFYPAAPYHHKNHENLLLAFKKVLADEKGKDVKLVFVGGESKKAYPLRKRIEELDLNRSVLSLGYIAKKDLIALYLGSLGLVFPSLYEGLGMPVLEALKYGCPVIVSNRCSLPEIVGDAAILINPLNPKDIFEAMLRFLSDETLRKSLIEKGFKQIESFSLDNTAKNYLSLFKEMERS